MHTYTSGIVAFLLTIFKPEETYGRNFFIHYVFTSDSIRWEWTDCMIIKNGVGQTTPEYMSSLIYLIDVCSIVSEKGWLWYMESADIFCITTFEYDSMFESFIVENSK